ncbi:amino-acid permease BAT1-like protein [Senna tora]|uniref:Amino-acid permease BAT1-like protein n=1 Tax=Senna tora TaxID=362788 RepID=A0A834WNS1_9FABA|nr:amino-acid permease BAT1-like protein [Senna tora]
MEREILFTQNGQPGSYFPLDDDDAVSNNSDDQRLKLLGYKQELRRSLSAVANFSVAFSIISVLTGLTTTFETGLRYGGPATMVYGWPLIGAMTMAVGLSMAEICSAFPTSGGLYFWSARLCGAHWGPLASWLTGW